MGTGCEYHFPLATNIICHVVSSQDVRGDISVKLTGGGVCVCVLGGGRLCGLKSCVDRRKFLKIFKNVGSWDQTEPKVRLGDKEHSRKKRSFGQFEKLYSYSSKCQTPLVSCTKVNFCEFSKSEEKFHRKIFVFVQPHRSQSRSHIEHNVDRPTFWQQRKYSKTLLFLASFGPSLLEPRAILGFIDKPVVGNESMSIVVLFHFMIIIFTASHFPFHFSTFLCPASLKSLSLHCSRFPPK